MNFAKLLGAAILWFPLAAGTASTKPNLLIITADDMNGDSWFNSKVGATPDLDAFAATCYRFENCHVAAPICQPSREALMTGRVPHRNGGLGFNPIRLDVPTLTEITRSNGYFTAAINKLAHMAPREKFNWDLPLDGSGKNPKLMREQFEQCLQAAAAAGKPFFINANITDPHRPFAGANEPDAEAPAGKQSKRPGSKNQQNASPVALYAPSEVVVPSFLEDIPGVRKEVAQYFSSVRRLNQTFAGLMDALKSAGQADNTVLVFLSDHGMSFPFAKATVYRHGTWSPLLFRWPGMGLPVVNRTDFVSTVDVMPTVLDLLNLPHPPGMDGRSFLPVLRGEKQAGRDHVFTYVNTVSSGRAFPGRCLRTRSRAYIWNSWPDGKTEYRVEAMSGLSFKALAEAATRDPRIKSRVEQYLFRTPEEFYDITTDPDERVNLINDPKYAGEIAQMKSRVLAEMKRSGDPLLEPFLALAQPASAGGEAGHPLPPPRPPIAVLAREGTHPASKFIDSDPASGSSLAVVVDENAALAHTAQVFPINRRGRLVRTANVARQATAVLDNLDAVLRSSRSSLAQAVKLNVYLVQPDALPTVRQALAERFSGEVKPAVSFVVGDLAKPGAGVAMDAVAVSFMEESSDGHSHESAGSASVRADQILSPPPGCIFDNITPVTVLPSGPKLYVSGMAEPGGLPVATRKTLEKLMAAIGHFALGKREVVQLKVFLQLMSEVASVHQEIVEFFGGQAPPTVFVEWISANPPVEIELIAAARGQVTGETDSVSFLTPPGTTDSKVYKRVTRINRGQSIYISGLYGMSASDGAGQVRAIFDQLRDLTRKTDSDFEHLVKATYYVTDEDASSKLNELRPEFYNPQRPPAASKAKVKSVGVPGRTVTLDMIAVTK